MKFLGISVFCLLVVFSFWAKMTTAVDTDTVAATVTAIIYQVAVEDGSIAFLTVPTSDTKDTTEGAKGVSDSQIATNNSSVAAKLNIKAVDSTGGAGWTLGASAGDETYTMKSCTSGCDGSPVWTSVGIGSTYATLTASVGVGSTQNFDLQVGTPTSTTETNEQTITVTVQAAQTD